MWLVCFTGRPEAMYWWDRVLFTRKHFRHAYVIQYQVDAERWILVDWRTGVCDVIAFEHDEMDYILNHLADCNGTAILVKGETPEKEIHYRVPLIYCVQAVLQVLGMPTRWTFTPYQLYKRLIKEGYEELINHRSPDNGKRKQTKDRSESGCNQPADSQASSA